MLIYYKNAIASKAVIFCHFLPCRFFFFLQYVSRTTLCTLTKNYIYNSNNKLDAVGIQACSCVQGDIVEIIHNEEVIVMQYFCIKHAPKLS